MFAPCPAWLTSCLPLICPIPLPCPAPPAAVTVGFLYVFGTGLVGFLLLQQFVAQGYWW